MIGGIDVGHGGRSPGVYAPLYCDVPEKDLNLEIALELEKQARLRGCPLLFSRTCDETVSPTLRHDRLADADYVLSIHHNRPPVGHLGSQRFGKTLFLHWPGNKLAQKVGLYGAKYMPDPLQRKGAVHAATREDWLAARVVLSWFSQPALVVEVCDVTNREDMAYRLGDKAAVPEIGWSLLVICKEFDRLLQESKHV